MKERFQLLLSLKVMEYEINELSKFAEECEDCFDLLKAKLDGLHQFITDDNNISLWREWGEDDDIAVYSERVREAAVQALCNLEKYQSVRSCNHQLNASEYIHTLSKSVKQEMEELQITCSSKVLFIGSGAFPVSALTIASEKKAEVFCVDIDQEAVIMGEKVAGITGLSNHVTFSNQPLQKVDFANEATHVVIASLVKNKQEVLSELKSALQPNTRVILRYGNGLKSIFNYPLETDLSKEWKLKKVTKADSFYDTLVLEKSTGTT
ncbi:nicotianamine synthase family protein [Fictibacillus sp. UD]|uniref:nicotianamine synthase family protein n=1 Tax=Fictibacillus sp. UD TaxID=3038777 RepID=UPI003744F0BB